jgi:hypothetical protein
MKINAVRYVSYGGCGEQKMKRLTCCCFMLSVGFSQAGDRGPDVQDDAKAKVAKSQVLLLSKAVDAFALMNKGEYPAKLEDLLATKPPIWKARPH